MLNFTNVKCTEFATLLIYSVSNGKSHLSSKVHTSISQLYQVIYWKELPTLHVR